MAGLDRHRQVEHGPGSTCHPEIGVFMKDLSGLRASVHDDRNALERRCGFDKAFGRGGSSAKNVIVKTMKAFFTAKGAQKKNNRNQVFEQVFPVRAADLRAATRRTMQRQDQIRQVHFGNVARIHCDLSLLNDNKTYGYLYAALWCTKCQAGGGLQACLTAALRMDRVQGSAVAFGLTVESPADSVALVSPQKRNLA